MSEDKKPSPLSLCPTCQKPLPFQESETTRWYYHCQKCHPHGVNTEDEPSEAAKQLLEDLGDGAHVLRSHSASYKKYRRTRADLREIYIALVLLAEGLKQGVANTELQGWHPEVREEAHHVPCRKDEGFSFVLGPWIVFFIDQDSDEIRYSYKDSEPMAIPRMVGESLADAAVRLVFNCIRPLYAHGTEPV